MPFKFIIVGAGLSGCLLANGLTNNGADVTLYERDSPNSKREGYQIRLGEASIKGFRVCLKEPHTEAILAKLGQSSGSTSTAPSIYTSGGRLLLDLSKIPSYSKSSAINRVVLRNILVQPVADSGHVMYGKAFLSYEIVGTGPTEHVRVNFEDGTSDTCDILIGADGSASRVNHQVGARNLVQITSHWSFLNKGKLPAAALRTLPPQLMNGPMMVFSKGSCLFYALYLPRKSDSHQDPKSSLDYDEEVASFFWGINIPKASIPYAEISDIPDKRQLCLDHVKNWAPEFHTMLSAGENDEGVSDIYAAKLRASDKPSKYWRDHYNDRSHGEGHPRVWLAGDAIHAMQPSRGMGGNQALLDCADMLPYLLKLSAAAEAGQRPTTEEIRVACDQYERKMLNRAFKWVQKSGGSTMLSIDLDSYLGILVYVVGKILVPILSLYYKVKGTR